MFHECQGSPSKTQDPHARGTLDSDPGMLQGGTGMIEPNHRCKSKRNIH